jgi:hypothetical protein
VRAHNRLALFALFLIAAASAVEAVPVAEARPLAATRKSDFNGDGFADLAVGAPFEDVGSATSAGSVNVLYGTSGGLSSSNNVQYYEGNGGVPGTAQTGDRYGQAVAAGDFDGDGYGDLAIGMPGKNIGSITNAGSVNILYGSANRLTTTGSQIWTQGSNGLIGSAEKNDGFGAALATGDLNGDGFADLAVNSDGETVSGNVRAGSVTIIYGASGGLAATGAQAWNQNTIGVDPAEGHDRLGSLAIGDFNNDGFGDLAMGVAYEDIGGNPDAGEVNVLYGSAGGLSTSGAQLWTQDSASILDQVEVSDGFGYSVAAGDLNGDGFGDLVVGDPGETVGSVSGAGSINIIYGSASGLTATNNQFLNQDSANVPGAAETDDQLGSSVAVGNFNGDGFGDVAAGAPFESVGSDVYAGLIDVFYGSATGVTTSGSQEWSQDSPNIEGGSEPGDFLGDPVTAQNFGNGTQDDVVFGAPGEDIGSVGEAGAVNVIYGSSSGLTSTGDQQWFQDSSNIGGTSELRDSFGWSIAAGAGR